MSHCWYVSQAWGVHDHRWVAALTEQGFEPTVLSLQRDALSITDVQHQIRARDTTSPILAGPLETVTKELTDLPNPVIGLSWGFDLLDMESSGQAMQWLTQLSHLIVDSSTNRSIAEAAGVDPERITTIPWGINVEQFTPEGALIDLSSWGIPVERPLALSLRALEELYRVEDVIRAWPTVLAGIPDAMLIVGNDGSLGPQLQALAAENDLTRHIAFIGRVSEGQLPALLRSVDAYISSSPIDGTSVTMLQAMGCRTPVIVTDTPGNREWIIPGVTGQVFPSGDPDELAAKIIHALKDDEASNAPMTVAARAQVLSRANWHENRRKLAQILSSL